MDNFDSDLQWDSRKATEAEIVTFSLQPPDTKVLLNDGMIEADALTRGQGDTVILIDENSQIIPQLCNADTNSDIAMLKKQCAEMSENRKLITTTSSDTKLELLLSNFLKYGVLIASAVVLLGGILYLIRHGAEPADYHIFHGTPSQFCSPSGVINAVLSGSSRGIIQLGLIILIAIPILRVIISLLTFLVQRNFIYVTVTSLVLAALFYSLVGAYSG
jgi:uncharacterized membrane protein